MTSEQQVILYTFVLHIQGGTFENVNYTTVRALCSYIFVLAVQESSKCTQHHSK